MAALDDRCELLEQAWRWWGDAVAALDTDAWQRSTRLPDWNIGALVAHHAMFVSLLGFVASQPLGDPPTVLSARDMLRRFNEPDGVATTAAGVVSQIAQQQAAERSAAEFVSMFRETAPEVLANVRAAGPIVVEYLGNGAFPLTEVLSIGLLEAVVHGLDLRAAVDELPALPEVTMAFATDLLASMADPMEFIEAATGRRSDPVLPVLR
jgi:uncharacterized protein (TIGR03083 family)